MAMKRMPVSQGGKPVAPPGVDADLKGVAPHVHEFLTEVVWDDGKRRDVGTVMLVLEGGWWKLWAHDRDGKRSAWIAGTSIQEALLELDQQLSEGRVAWRPDRR